MTWLFYTLISIIFFSFLNLSERLIGTKSKSPRAASFVFNSIASAITIIILALFGELKNVNLNAPFFAWVTVFIACFFYALYERNRFLIYKYLDASNTSIVGNVSTVIAFIGSLFIYHESLSLSKTIGSVLIIIALIVISKNKSHSSHFSIKGLLLGILIFSYLGIAIMLDKAGTTNFNSSTYSIFAWVFPTIIIYFPRLKKSEIVTEMKLGSWKIIVAAGLNAFGYLFMLKAIEITEATKVLPILQTSTFLTVILAALFLGEKENLPRKALCALLAIIGSSLLITT